MRRTPDRSLEGAHELGWAQRGFTRQLVDRHAPIETSIDELEDAPLRRRRQSTTHYGGAPFTHPSLQIDLQAQSGHERLDERKSARVAAIRFGQKRAHQMLDLRSLHAVHPAERGWRTAFVRFAAGADESDGSGSCIGQSIHLSLVTHLLVIPAFAGMTISR